MGISGLSGSERRGGLDAPCLTPLVHNPVLHLVHLLVNVVHHGEGHYIRDEYMYDLQCRANGVAGPCQQSGWEVKAEVGQIHPKPTYAQGLTGLQLRHADEDNRDVSRSREDDRHADLPHAHPACGEEGGQHWSTSISSSQRHNRTKENTHRVPVSPRTVGQPVPTTRRRAGPAPRARIGPGAPQASYCALSSPT